MLSFVATLTKKKRFENAFIYLKLVLTEGLCDYLAW